MSRGDEDSRGQPTSAHWDNNGIGFRSPLRDLCGVVLRRDTLMLLMEPVEMVILVKCCLVAQGLLTTAALVWLVDHRVG